jgi:hypothetical protein
MNKTRDSTDEKISNLRAIVIEKTTHHQNFMDEIQNKSQGDFALFENLTKSLQN